jgi:hypothetical protein
MNKFEKLQIIGPTNHGVHTHDKTFLSMEPEFLILIVLEQILEWKRNKKNTTLHSGTALRKPGAYNSILSWII